MVDPSVPAEVVVLADERAEARARRDYGAADELKSRIEAAGWKVVDLGVAYELEPARPPDVIDGERTLFGAVESVPSRLDEAASDAASVIVLTADAPTTAACLQGLAATAPAGTQVIVVHGPEAVIDGPVDEIVATAIPFSAADALQAGLRRSTGAVVIVLEPALRPTSDVVTPIVEALADPTVAIVAADGLRSADLHRYRPADAGDVTTVGSGCYGFRRADVAERGPIDGRLRLRASVAAWLGLLLRDEGPGARPRRAVVVDLPLQPPGTEAPVPAEHARLARRDGYRIADRFRDHDWLASEDPPEGRLVGDGADDGKDHDDPDERGDAAKA